MHAISDRPLRVLLMSGSLEGGGSEQQTLLLLRHLNRSAFSPELYLSYRRGVLLPQVPADVPVHAFWDPPRRAPRVNWPGRIGAAQVRHLARLIEDQQIDVVYDRGFHMTLIAAPAARRTGRPRVATIVCPPEGDLPRTEARFLSLKRWLLARYYAGAHARVAVSDAVADSAARYYRLPRDRFVTIHNPIDLGALDGAASDSPPPRREGVVQLVCVGRMTWEKGHAVLLDALGRLGEPRPDLWMVGDGPLRSELQQRAVRLGINSHVHFTGHLPSAAAAISAADLLCLPSLYEGLPNVVMESLALGVPVIATEAGGTPELLRPPGEAAGEAAAGEPPRGVMVPPGDAAALAAAIGRFLEDRQGFAQRAAQARAAFRAQHAVERIVPRIERRLLEAKGASASA